MITLPEAFEQEMKQLLGEEEYEAYRKTFDEAVHRGLRVNNGKISTEEFLRRTDIPLKKVPWIPNGFYYDEESCNPAKDADYYAGLYYLQEPSAMTPASRLPIEPDDRVLDLCAAPGGKATELGSRIGRHAAGKRYQQFAGEGAAAQPGNPGSGTSSRDERGSGKISNLVSGLF